MKHQDQVRLLLQNQIRNRDEVEDIVDTAAAVAKEWVKPLAGGRDQTNGLIYGLVQSGKTGVLTVTGAIGADEGYRTILVLTSDNDPLYAQTLDRIRESFPGMDIIAKADFRNADAFLERIKRGTCAIVTTKNARLLKTLIENFKVGNVRGLTCLIIDDEADQASLNTRASKKDGSRSAINDALVELRHFFERNTYLQVTATPQALFLQSPGHDSAVSSRSLATLARLCRWRGLLRRFVEASSRVRYQRHHGVDARRSTDAEPKHSEISAEGARHVHGRCNLQEIQGSRADCAFLCHVTLEPTITSTLKRCCATTRRSWLMTPRLAGQRS